MAEPGGSEPAGPFPPGVAGEDAEQEYDKLRRRVLWSFPSGLYVLGSRSGDERNAMTISWVTQVSFDPKLVGVAVEKGAVTHRLVADGHVFSVCTVARDDRAIVRKFTKPVDQSDTSGPPGAITLNGFAFHDGASGAPVLDQAPAFVDCAVRHAFDLGTHTLFVGEVIDCAFQSGEDTEVLRMEDTRMSYGG